MWLELAILARPLEACSPAPKIGAGIFYEVQHFVTRMQITMHGSLLAAVHFFLPVKWFDHRYGNRRFGYRSSVIALQISVSIVVSAA